MTFAAEVTQVEMVKVVVKSALSRSIVTHSKPSKSRKTSSEEHFYLGRKVESLEIGFLKVSTFTNGN